MVYLFMAFGAVWLLVTLYLVLLGLRQRRIEDEMASLLEEVRARHKQVG